MSSNQLIERISETASLGSPTITMVTSPAFTISEDDIYDHNYHIHLQLQYLLPWL